MTTNVHGDLPLLLAARDGQSSQLIPSFGLNSLPSGRSKECRKLDSQHPKRKTVMGRIHCSWCPNKYTLKRFSVEAQGGGGQNSKRLATGSTENKVSRVRGCCRKRGIYPNRQPEFCGQYQLTNWRTLDSPHHTSTSQNTFEGKSTRTLPQNEPRQPKLLLFFGRATPRSVRLVGKKRIGDPAIQLEVHQSRPALPQGLLHLVGTCRVGPCWAVALFTRP